MKRYLNVDLAKAVKLFEVAVRKMVTTRIVGHYQSIFRGKGLEFDSYRDYNPQIDDAQRIDWKASMRANEILIKNYIEERDLQILFAVDINSSMVFGSAPKLKNEYALEVIAALANYILRTGDRVGFVLFNDKIVKTREPATGQKQYFALTKSLLDPNIYGGDCDLGNVLRNLARTLTSEISVMILISDFLGPRDWEREIKVISKKVETIAVMICDPRDRTLPAESEQIVVADPYSNKSELIDPLLIKERYERYAKQQEEEVIRFLSEAGCDFVKIMTDKSFILPLATFFRMRAGKRR